MNILEAFLKLQLIQRFPVEDILKSLFGVFVIIGSITVFQILQKQEPNIY